MVYTLLAWLVSGAEAEPGAHAGGCPLAVADLPASPLYARDDRRLGGPALVVVLKEARRMGLYRSGALATTEAGHPACWSVALAAGYAPGHKRRQGDRKTPEGWQRTSDRPWSRFYHALTVHYPAPADARAALKDGRIDQKQHDAILAAHAKGLLPPMYTPLGGLIAIHGGGGTRDWTGAASRSTTRTSTSCGRCSQPASRPTCWSCLS